MNGIGGYMGKILRVDLSSGKTGIETFDEKTLRKYPGGVALGVKIFYDEVSPNVKPFDPENKLIITTAPFAGTAAPATSLYNVVTKGALTNLLTSSQANGYFAARLKFAGFDAIIIEGAASEWKYLYINNGNVELREARNLLGKDTIETENFLKEELNLKKSSVVSIGQAGENMVRFAAIQSDKGHFASTNGAGAVMGSKKLKAIIVYGDIKPQIADMNKFKELTKQWIQNVMMNQVAQGVAYLGTAMYFSPLYNMGCLPVKNLSEFEFPEHTQFDGMSSRFNPRYKLKKDPCYACPLGHVRKLTILEGPYEGKTVDDPEYEGYAAFGPNIGNTNLDEAIVLNDMNDRLGMDLKECGFTLSWAMECYEKGYITKKDTDGLELTWGNVPEIKKLLTKIANRDGFGNLLAEGVMRASDAIGGKAKECAVYSKNGIAPHMHDPRGNWGMVFNQGISDMGSMEGDVPIAAPIPELGFMETISPYDPEKIPTTLAGGVKKNMLQDSLLVCMFANIGLQTIMDTFNAVTGWDMTLEEGFEVGERTGHLMRAYNIRCGATPEGDKISQRLAEAPIGGPAKGIKIGPVFDDMKKRYYKAQGWDEETSKPLPETLKKVGLDHVIQDLW